MSDVVEHNGEQFFKTKIAAEKFGYTSDYVGRFLREKKIRGVKEGKQWYVSLDSLQAFVKETERKKTEQKQVLSQHRKQELKRASEPDVVMPQVSVHVAAGRLTALAETITILFVGVFAGASWHVVSQGHIDSVYGTADLTFSQMALAWYEVLSSDALPEENNGVVDEPKVFEAPDATAGEHYITSIEQSFSDRVEVFLDEEEPGVAVVVPKFGDDEGEAYRFRITPEDDTEMLGGK